jgi:hypothetical protein
MKSTKNTTHNYPVKYFLIESELLMREENLLSRLKYVTNIEASGLMIVPRQHWLEIISRYKQFKRLLQSLQFTRNVVIYFRILAKFKHQYYSHIIRQQIVYPHKECLA